MSSSMSAILYKAAKETAVEYFQKTSLNGFGLLYYIRRRKYQRTFWFMFIVMGVSFAIYVCLTTMVSFLSEPTVTALDTQEYTIWDVPFPSIAVCSKNKFSRQAMKEYAENITRSSFDWNLPDQSFRKLQLFAGFYNTDSIDFDEAVELQKSLDKMYMQNFHTGDLLKSLAPKCQDLLLQCFWSGQPMRCEDELKAVAFANGHCCVFNYHYGMAESDLYYANDTGHEMGLTLVLNASTKDYFYNEDSSNGYTIQIFGKQRIPDASTGDVSEFHVDAGDDIEINLKLVSQISTSETRDYRVEKRGCYFANERKEAVYGQAACLMNCRIRSIATLCDCVPFYVYDSNSTESEIQCSLAHTECLERYRITWQTYSPAVGNINQHLKDELIDSLDCPECLPLCTYHRYQYFKAKNNLKDSYNYPDSRKFLASVPKSPDISLVKIYYSSAYGTRYKKNVLYNWYQMLSNVGGVIGICMGCSIISGFEIIYFGTVRLVENYLKLKARRR